MRDTKGKKWEKKTRILQENGEKGTGLLTGRGDLTKGKAKRGAQQRGAVSLRTRAEQ